MTLRHFNYTQRKRLRREDARLSVVTRAGRTELDVYLNLEDYGLPPAAAVVVEAYRQTEVRRFEFGTVGQSGADGSLDLTGFLDLASVLFRVKVVDRSEKAGRLLAEASGLQPESGESAGQRSLLVVRQESLHGELWRVVVENEHPVLLLEKSYGPKEILLGAPHFRWLVLPALMRELLRRALADGVPDQEDGWKATIVDMAAGLVGESPPETDVAENDQEEWITSAVRAFCRRHGLSRYRDDVFGATSE